MLYRQLWAKSYPDDPLRFHPLWCHLLDVAAVCEVLLPRFGGIAGVPDEWISYFAGLHDIGKADARFQGKAPKLASQLIQAPPDVIASPDDCIGFRHEARSADWIKPHLEKLWGQKNSAARVIMQAVQGHHGDFQAGSQNNANYNETQYAAYSAFYPPLRDELAQLIADQLRLWPIVLDEFLDASVAGMKMSGLIVLSDWIASNPDTYGYPSLYSKLVPDIEPAVYWANAQAEAIKAVERLKLDAVSGGSVPQKLLFAEVWPDCPDLRPSQQALQDAVLNEGVPPGLTIIEAPMGEGKTEAALYLAACWNRAGAYIALPTQATSNQMHRRYEEFLAGLPGGRAPRLVHGMAWLLDAETPERTSQTWGPGKGADDEERQLSRDWFANAKRALLATDGVGTVDQVLMAALNVKHGFLRFLGLTSKTLIIDEVHAYDIYMTTLMKMLLRWCYALDVPVILLSATLSHAQKRELVSAYAPPDAPGDLPRLAANPAEEPYPLLTFFPRGGEALVKEAAQTSPPNPQILLCQHVGALGRADEIARLTKETVADGGCACVIANTVGSAQKIFQALQADPPADTQLLLFHARFRAERRQKLEDEVVRLFGKADDGGKNELRPKRAILVATQVVEQSLDIDFDVMLSEIAPIDLLLQRSGRMHRHAINNPRPTGSDTILHVLLPETNAEGIKFGGMEVQPSKDRKSWHGVYDRAALLKTLALLESRPSISLPADFRPLIEACYGDAPLQVSSIRAEWITEAEKLCDERRQGSEAKAKIHLIPCPDEEEFSYAEVRHPEAEAEEGERANYFRLSTREGDDSRAALILHDPALVANVRQGGLQDRESGQEWRPNKKLLRKLFLQKVSLPAYWLAYVTAAEGHELLTGADVPKRLRHHVVLVMRENVWKGSQTDKEGKTTPVTIIDDDALGLSWTPEK